jgi:uncharacterized protein YbjT (DUF2867 family)
MRNPEMRERMSQNRILVIGGTGNVGRHVVSGLSARGAQFRVMSRDPTAAALPPRAEVVCGDLTAPETLDRCLEDVETVFLVWVAPLTAATSILEKIAERARRIVFLTAPLKTPHPFFQQPNPSREIAERIERLIETSGLEWTFVRAGMFAGNALHFWGPQIRCGAVVRWPYLDTPTAPTDERDVAGVAVRALCDDGHAGAEYVVTGPQSLTQAEQVHTIGRAIGRYLHAEEISPDQARSELLPILGSPGVVDMLLNAWDAALGQPAFVTSTCAEITGAPARTFADWATDHAAAFR